jgi:transposase
MPAHHTQQGIFANRQHQPPRQRCGRATAQGNAEMVDDCFELERAPGKSASHRVIESLRENETAATGRSAAEPANRVVQMRVAVRRFRCADPKCRRRIFAEALGDAVAGRSARRTSRLEAIVHHLGIALGGRPAAALARRLMLPVSKDTLLRTVRRHAAGDSFPLHVIGIDDWAWKRGQRCGSIICDFEQRRVVDLLPDREPPRSKPGFRAIQRSPSSRATAATGMAKRTERRHRRCKADRWHLMQNASAAFLEVCADRYAPYAWCSAAPPLTQLC